MKCYVHEEISAVGICKHCNKGICPSCLSDTGDGIACIGHCTEEVILINKLINHNKKVVKGTRGSWTSSGLLFLIMGTIFIVSGFLYLKRFDPFMTGMGVLFLTYGLYVVLKAKSYKEDERDF